MKATKLGRSQGGTMLKAMSMALKPSEELLEKQKVLLTHLTRNSYKSAEEKLESGKAEKLKAVEEKKQSGFLYQLVIKNKILEKTGKNTMEWMGKKWKLLLGLGLFLLPKSFWTGLKDLINKVILEVPNIIDSIKDGTFLEKYGKGIGETIGGGLALYIAGSAFKAIVLPALGTIFSTAISSIILKKTIKDAITKNLPAGVSKATPKITASPTSTMSTTPVSKASKVGKGMRLLPMLSAAGKIAGYAWAAYSLIDGIQTGLKEESFSAGFGQFWQTMWGGILGDKTQVQNLLNGVGDTILKASSAITKTFVKLATMDYKKKAKELWAPVQKQLDEKQKKKDERTKIPSTSTSLDLSDDAQKGRLKDKVAKAQKKYNASPASLKALQELQKAQAELKNYGVGSIPKTGTRTKAPKFVGGTSKSGIQQLKDDEGFRPKVYDDTEGIKTIGFGFNLEREGTQKALDSAGIKKSVADLKSGKVNLTEKEAERLMMGEYPYFRQAAKRYLGEDKWPPFPESKKDALTNMAYNLGEKSLNTFTNLREALRNEDYELAGQEVLKSKYATQVGDRAHRISGALSASVPPMDKSNAFNAQQNMNNELKGSGNGGSQTIVIDKSQNNTTGSNTTTMAVSPSATDGKQILNKT